VREMGTVNVGPGRPGVMIDIDPDGGRLIGAEIGVDFISVVLTDFKAKVVWRRKLETNGSARQQDKLIEMTEGLVQEAIDLVRQSGQRLLGIGLGLPGLIDHATGTLLFAPNLGWSNVPFREMWQHFGEYMLGNAKHIENFIYLSAGVGLGGGLMIGGKLYGGVGGYAGEIGHMTLAPDGPQCACGNRGCWETFVGPTAILDRIRQAALEGHTPLLLALPEVNSDVSAIRMRHVFEAADRGEAMVLQVLDDVGRYLGIGIASLLNALNPSLVVLGGVLSLAGPYILPRAQREVGSRALLAARADVELKLSAFKFDACVMGGVSLIVREVLNNPTGWKPD